VEEKVEAKEAVEEKVRWWWQTVHRCIKR
jgi:hypothetical protein